VIRRLDLPQTPEELARQITATSVVDSVLIDVEVTSPSPERAAQMANSVGNVFTRLVDELERPTTTDGVPPVAVRIVQPAVVPTAPSSTGLPVTLALGLLAGLAVGVGAALARNALDASVKSPERLREVAPAPILGTVAYDPQVPKRPLTLHEDPQSPRSEAFRQLRTNLQFVDVDHPRKVIVVTSSVPGEGKTTTVCNLAIAMAAAGSRILVIDGDLRRPKVADLLGVERSVGLTSILAGQVRVAQAIQPWAGGRFDVLASGPLPPNPSELLASEHTEDLLEELRERYETVLIDSPPLLPVTDAAAVAPATDGVILVCRFKQTSQGQVKAAVEALEAVSTPLLGTVFSMVPSSGPRAYAQYNSSYRTEEPLLPSGQNGFGYRTGPHPRNRSTAPADSPADQAISRSCWFRILLLLDPRGGGRRVSTGGKLWRLRERPRAPARRGRGWPPRPLRHHHRADQRARRGSRRQAALPGRRPLRPPGPALPRRTRLRPPRLRGAELPSQIVTAREGKASIACASNAPFSEWGRTFTDPRLAARRRPPHLPRQIIQTGTDSYRLRATCTARREPPDPPQLPIITSDQQLSPPRAGVGPNQAITVGPDGLVILRRWRQAVAAPYVQDAAMRPVQGGLSVGVDLVGGQLGGDPPERVPSTFDHLLQLCNLVAGGGQDIVGGGDVPALIGACCAGCGPPSDGVGHRAGVDLDGGGVVDELSRCSAECYVASSGGDEWVTQLAPVRRRVAECREGGPGKQMDQFRRILYHPRFSEER